MWVRAAFCNVSTNHELSVYFFFFFSSYVKLIGNMYIAVAVDVGNIQHDSFQ